MYFKSLASTRSATPAARVQCPCYHDFGPAADNLRPALATFGPNTLGSRR